VWARLVPCIVVASRIGSCGMDSGKLFSAMHCRRSPTFISTTPFAGRLGSLRWSSVNCGVAYLLQSVENPASCGLGSWRKLGSILSKAVQCCQKVRCAPRYRKCVSRNFGAAQLPNSGDLLQPLSEHRIYEVMWQSRFDFIFFGKEVFAGEVDQIFRGWGDVYEKLERRGHTGLSQGAPSCRTPALFREWESSRAQESGACLVGPGWPAAFCHWQRSLQ